MMKHLFFMLAFLAFAVSGAVAQTAATPKLEKQFRDWGHYSHSDSQNNNTCYVLSIPNEKLPVALDHGDVFFLVSQNGSGGFEPMLEVGYNLKAGSEVSVVISNRKYEMFADGKNAWLKNPTKESELVQAMRAGNRMTVSAVSARGNNTAYTFSLSGVTAALRGANSCK